MTVRCNDCFDTAVIINPNVKLWVYPICLCSDCYKYNYNSSYEMELKVYLICA